MLEAAQCTPEAAASVEYALECDRHRTTGSSMSTPVLLLEPNACTPTVALLIGIFATLALDLEDAATSAKDPELESRTRCIFVVVAVLSECGLDRQVSAALPTSARSAISNAHRRSNHKRRRLNNAAVKTAAVFRCPWRRAAVGVSSCCAFGRPGSAPALSTSSSARAVWPCLAAACSAVSPYGKLPLAERSGRCWWFKRTRTTAVAPAAAARWIGAFPFSDSALASAPMCKQALTISAFPR